MSAVEPADPASAPDPVTPGKKGARRRSELPFSLSFGFGIGTVGVSCLLNPISMYFPAMLATVLGLSPAIAGVLLTAAKLYDIVADLVIGAVSDRTRSRWGRRRPYMFVGSIVGAAAFAMIFNPWPGLSGTALIVMLGVLLVIYSTGYSLFNIPYIAMPAEMTDDLPSRTSLISYRTFFIAAGQMTSVAGGAWIISRFGGGADGYAAMGLTLAALILVTTQTTVFMTRKARRKERVETHEPVRALAHTKMVFSNRPFVLLMTAKLFVLFGQAATATTLLLFLLNVLRTGYQGQVWISVAENIALGLSLVVWLRLIHRFGKRPVYIAGLCSQALLSLAWLRPDLVSSYHALAVIGLLKGTIGAGMLLAGTSMLPDTMQYDFMRTGLRREGIFASVYAIIEKIAFALAPAVIGGYLAFSGYIPTLDGAIIDQPESARLALMVTLVGVPVVSYLVAAVLIWFYPLTDAMLSAAKGAAVAAPDAAAATRQSSHSER